MQKLTITVDDAVYAGLKHAVGAGKISKFLNDLAKPYVVPADLEAAYAEMAAEADREREAQEWCEGLVGDSFR